MGAWKRCAAAGAGGFLSSARGAPPDGRPDGAGEPSATPAPPSTVPDPPVESRPLPPQRVTEPQVPIEADPASPQTACTVKLFRADGTLARQEEWAKGPVPLDASLLPWALSTRAGHGEGLIWESASQLLAWHVFDASEQRIEYGRVTYSGQQLQRLVERSPGSESITTRTFAG